MDEDPATAVRLKSVSQGAATSVWAAFVAPAELMGGPYCEDCAVAQVAERGLTGVRSYAIDPKRARQLWTNSEELIGERFPA